MHKLIYRPVLIISLVLGVLIVIELGALSGVSWINQQRIDIIKQNIKQGNQLQHLIFELLKHQEHQHNTDLITDQPTNHQQTAIHREILGLIKSQLPMTKTTSASLQKIQALLISIEQGHQQDRIKAIQLSSEVLRQQIQEEENLLDKIHQDSQFELKLAIFVPVGFFLILLLLGYFFLNRHVFTPINALEKLLSNLINGEKQPIENLKVDAVLQPLFSNYNRLVTRLSELEQEHLEQTDSLEKKIHNATHTLLELSHSLARADRLAAVGELAASAAHELRNPLAGIQLALENMCNDCLEQDMLNRLQMVNSEIKRLTRRLNDILAHSKQTPEKAKQIHLHHLVKELMTLLKYQVNENITLYYQVDDDINLFLPENELRQALLNLLLNAIQSIGEQMGTVYLQVQKQSENLIIEISDTGQAFPELLLKQGIRPFASYKEQGTGLGLPMVQRFAKSYGGQLKLFNNRQGHACASLILAYQS